MGIRDTRMLAAAIEKNYPLSDDQRKAVLSVLLKIALNPNSSAREKTSAARAILAADQLNIERERLAQAESHHEDRINVERLDRIAEVAKQLGLTQVLDAVSKERARVVSVVDGGSDAIK